MAYHLHDINHRIRTDVHGFIEESDAYFNKKVANAAAQIAKNVSLSPIVLLSGPSGSGKTTTALKIEAELRRIGINSHTISLDNYFMTVDPMSAPRNDAGEIDYESPFCLDMDLLNLHFTMLDKGEEIWIPKFEFARQMRNAQFARPFQLQKNEIAIFEGIHALNDMITLKHPQAYKLYISARSNVEQENGVCFKGTWMRLVRRTVRDVKFRGSGAEFTVKLWANVRRGEKLYISPFKSNADLLFDSSLPYEVSVMKNLAAPLFSEIPPDVQRREELFDLLCRFECFESIDPALVHVDSLLREFIGGGSYQY